MLPGKKISQKIFSIFLVVWTFTGTLAAQIQDPVSWNFSVESVSDSTATLVFRAEIKEPWHMYSTEKTEAGPIPTRFSFQPDSGYTLDGNLTEISQAIEYFDKGFRMNLHVFNKEAIFHQKIKILKPSPFTIEGDVEYMSCDNENCLPPAQKFFSFAINGNLNPAGKSAGSDSIPAGTIREAQPDPQKDRSLAGFFLIALLAGLAGIFTPCVFPMIPMTVSFFLNGENKSGAILKALLFGISIILIYTLIGILVGLTHLGADFANQLSTHWLPNALFFLLFVIFALSFLGLFEITLPSGLVNKVDRQADKGGFFAIFFMALTLVVVSFSCTGPIVGALLVEAAAGGMAIKPILGMFGFSLAFALPFSLLAIFPSRLKKLPKSGSWLNAVKIVMGFLLLAFSMKYVSTIDQVYHLGWITRDVFIAIWIVIFGTTGLYLLGKIRLSHGEEMKSVGTWRLMLALGVLSFTVYLIPGLWGARLDALSALLPPMSSQQFKIQEGVPGESLSEMTLCESPKYGDILSLPYDLKGYFDYEQGMACAKSLNKPVLIDFKGHACSNCKIMEAEVWSHPEILDLLRKQFVIIALYTDDRTLLPENQWIVSKLDGRLKKTMGQINADFEMSHFKSNTMPLYVIIDSGGKMLTEPMGYQRDPEKFLDFLKKGLKSE